MFPARWPLAGTEHYFTKILAQICATASLDFHIELTAPLHQATGQDAVVEPGFLPLGPLFSLLLRSRLLRPNASLHFPDTAYTYVCVNVFPYGCVCVCLCIFLF